MRAQRESAAEDFVDQNMTVFFTLRTFAFDEAMSIVPVPQVPNHNH